MKLTQDIIDQIQEAMNILRKMVVLTGRMMMKL